jgi:hypothetical protein
MYMTLSEEKRLIKTVNEYFSVDITSNKRQRELVDIKHAFRFNMRKLGYRFADIGRMLNCNHATVVHSVTASKNLIETDRSFETLSNIMGDVIRDFHAANKLLSRVNENIAKKSITMLFCDLLDRSSEFIDHEELVSWLDRARIQEFEFYNIVESTKGA